SYATLSQPAQRMFRLLGLVPGSDFSVGVASNVADLPLADAERLLDELSAAHLINLEAPGRYSFHDLLRLHAAEHAGAEEAEPAWSPWWRTRPSRASGPPPGGWPVPSASTCAGAGTGPKGSRSPGPGSPPPWPTTSCIRRASCTTAYPSCSSSRAGTPRRSST